MESVSSRKEVLIHEVENGATQCTVREGEASRISAEGSNKPAQSNVVEDEYKSEFEQCKAAAEQGDANAQCLLGEMYERGQGVLQDYMRAAELYKLAAEQSNAKAQYNLGNMYRLGNGVNRDYNRAAEFYKLAADQGYA